MAKVGQAMSTLEPQPVNIYIGNGRDSKGGPGTFIKNLLEVCQSHNLAQISTVPHEAAVYLVVAESVSIRCLWQFWRTGRPIIHRLGSKRTPIRTSLQQLKLHEAGKGRIAYSFALWRSQTRKMLRVWLSVLLADAVIYQSSFVKRQWAYWERFRQWLPNRFSAVIVNGQPLGRLLPRKVEAEQPGGTKRIIAAQGFLRKSRILAALVEQIIDPDFQKQARLRFPKNPVQIDIFGHIERLDGLQATLDAFQESQQAKPHVWIEFHGLKSSSIVEDALVNPRTVGTMLLHDCSACPNFAFESQALGLPVIGSQGGANPEILLFKELLLDPFQKSPALFRRQLLCALEFCLTLPPQKRTQLADMTASAFGDNKFEEYLRFIEFVVQQKAH